MDGRRKADIMQMANEKVMKKSEAIEVFITDFELE